MFPFELKDNRHSVCEKKMLKRNTKATRTENRTQAFVWKSERKRKKNSDNPKQEKKSLTKR